MSSYGNIPVPDDAHMTRGYGTAVAQDFAQPGHPTASSPITQSVQQTNAFSDFDQSKRESSFLSDATPVVDRAGSAASTAGTPSRNNTLRKKGSVKRTASLRRSSSRRSLKAGSIKGLGNGDDPRAFNNAFYTPIPTQGTPTEVLAERFQAWRQFLKSLITYFREIQATYDQRAKAIHKVQNVLSNISHPAVFTTRNGLAEASRILEDHHKRSIAEANKSRDIENDVIGALTGLRNDLGQKIKEIKSLSGDFKNSVSRETDATRREVDKLQEALQYAGLDETAPNGKHDPYVVRLGVDRAIEKQIDEENYLHRAYLNLESSGRELESIVVGEVQKAYNALAGILRREADDAYTCVENLRTGPIAMPKDQEWMEFVVNDPHFVDPNLPLRRIEDITYPGKFDPAATEIRAGMLERKSKYLKSYSPGWYVLSPTHLHEFKSADKIHSQPPVMSLPLSEQKLGSKSEPGSSSHKFMLKGKQSGGMHKGHNWVFRAESHDTMLAWFDDIRALTEKTAAERKAFVRSHARSVSGTSDKGTVSTEGLEDDEADAMPYSAANSLAAHSPADEKPKRPQPGGRFPSDLRIPLVADAGGERVSEESSETAEPSRPMLASTPVAYARSGQDPYRLDGVASHTRATSDGQGFLSNPAQDESIEQQQQQTQQLSQPTQTSSFPAEPPSPVSPLVHTPSAQQPVQPSTIAPGQPAVSPLEQDVTTTAAPAASAQPAILHDTRPASSYGDWMTPVAVGAAGVGAGAAGAAALHSHPPETSLSRDEATPTEPVVVPPTTPNTSLLSATPDPKGTKPQTPSSLSVMSDDTEATEGADVATPLVASPPGFPLGGLEKEGAVETGRAIPVIRHRSDMSVSGLHIPGGFPKRED